MSDGALSTDCTRRSSFKEGLFTATKKVLIEWHDLRIAQDDLPEPYEDVLVTKENFEGTRSVVSNVYYKELANGSIAWCTTCPDSKYGVWEEIMIWDEIIAWSYYPEPYTIY